MRRVSLLACVTALASLAVVLAGSSRAADAPPEMPKPGPEHELLKKMEGTWQATVKMTEPAIESKGTFTCKMECGGLWLSTNFVGDAGGMSFQGKGFDGYDVAKKKYVSVWVDSMGTAPEMMEGTYDKKTKTMTMAGEHAGPDGKLVKNKIVSVRKDDDTLDATFYTIGKDGKETQMMTINYKRKK